MNEASVSIVVPFLSDGAERDRNWAYVRARYEALYPEWQIVEGTCELPWRKGRAVNEAVKRSEGDVLVISDADVMIAEEALRDAVRRLEVHPWIVPHRMVYRLNEKATKALVENRLFVAPRTTNENLERVRKGSAGGGIAVMGRLGWETVRGMDERFEGWGGEDASFGFALDTLIGPHLRLNQAMWHLYHEPLPMRPGHHGSRGRGSEGSEALAGRYSQANGDPVAMHELVEEHHKGMFGGGIVVTRKEVYERVPLDPVFEGWGQEDFSWSLALQCLAGPPRKGTAELVHLHHPLPSRLSRAHGSQENWDRRHRYILARNKPNQMDELLEEARVALKSHGHALHAGQTI